jgi:antitoxin FitA
MSVAITVREVPDAVRDELAARAARSGRSMQEYLRALLVEQASKPSREDLIARVRERVGRSGSRATTQSILTARDADRR